MTEKRYYVNCAGYLCDMDLSNTLSIFECADLLNSLSNLLNSLSKENEELKQTNQELYDELQYLQDRFLKEMDMKRVENEQLKSDNKCYVKRYSELFEDYIACKKENEQLKQQVSEQGTQIDFLKDENKHMRDLVNENEQLKQELQEFKEWEKWVGDVKREEVDRVFKMSIYEIAEAFEYYKNKIKELKGDVE